MTVQRNKVGSPRKFKDVKTFNKKVESYFKECESNGKVPNVLGLCIHLDIIRDTLIEYEKRPEFTDTIKEARQKIEEFKMQKLYSQGNVTGVIFDLKCNHGWVDKQVIEQDIKLTTVESLLKDNDVKI